MDSELRCNRLTCRKTLIDRAVVTTCSHIFCVDCANELFNASRLCPACETSLTEPDDVVVCSLHPTNDYKTVNICAKFLWNPGSVSVVCPFGPQPVLDYGNMQSGPIILAVSGTPREVRATLLVEWGYCISILVHSNKRSSATSMTSKHSYRSS